MIILKQSKIKELIDSGFIENGYYNTLDKHIENNGKSYDFHIDVDTMEVTGTVHNSAHTSVAKVLGDVDILQLLPEISRNQMIKKITGSSVETTLREIVANLAKQVNSREVYSKVLLDGKEMLRTILRNWFEATESLTCSYDKASFCVGRLMKALETNQNISLSQTYREYQQAGGNLGGINEQNTDLDSRAYWCPKLIPDTDALSQIVFDCLCSSTRIAQLEYTLAGKSKDGSKLVRDLIPDHIASQDKAAKFHYAEDANEFIKRAKMKLREEVTEYEDDETLEELADIMEVVYAIAKVKHNCSMKQLNKIRLEKKAKNGSFDKQIVLEEII